MNSNYEAVSSLVELLVKKAGFDVTKDYSETELKKTRETIDNLLKKKTTATNKKTVAQIIENLKVREANWEQNAEIVGKDLLKAYKEGKDYESVKERIDLLGNLALEGTSSISARTVYDKLKKLENKYNELIEKIETYDYSNKEEKEMDERYKVYLENKITSLDGEITTLEQELDSLREVEIKDENIVSELKEYLNKLNKDREKINTASNMAMNSDVQFDVWERLEKAKTTTKEKLLKSTELLKRTEDMLNDVKKTRNGINDRKMALNAEKMRCTTKLNTITNKLNDGKYENSPERMIDINNSEIMKLEINSLSNKKDVIYVDANKVKEELIREWSNISSASSEFVSKVSSDVKEKKEETTLINEEIENDSIDELDKTLKDLQEIIDKSEIIRDNIVDNTSHTSTSGEDEIEFIEDSMEESIVPHKEVEELPSTTEVLEVIDEIAQSSVDDNSNEEVKQEKKNKMELDW